MTNASAPDELAKKRDEMKSTSSAFFPSAILLSAVELGVFTALWQSSLSAAELARQLGVDARALGVLLEALASLGYVARTDDARFHNTAVSERYLSKQSADYEGDSAEMSLWFMRLAGGLADVVKRGAPADTMEHAVATTPSRGASIAHAMDQIAVDFIPALVANVDMTGVKTLLDIGGAAGTYAHALIAAHPNARATVLELPHAAAEAKRIASSRAPAGGGWERVDVTAGDFRSDDLGGPWSMIFASNVFHLLAPDAARDLLHRAARALAPGGRLVIKEMLGTGGGLAPGLAVYATLMLLISDRGALHDEASYARWCEEAGLSRPKRIDCWQRSSLLIATRP